MYAATELIVCTCCYYATAGYPDHETGMDHTHCQHGDDMPLSSTVGTVHPGGESSDTDGDGDLESRFNTSSCDGCGTLLAGERYFATEHAPCLDCDDAAESGTVCAADHVKY